MAQVLDSAAVSAALAELDGWSFADNAITRTVQLPSFAAALAAVARVGAVAEAMNHHPDIDIRYDTLRFACSTHSAGGVTEKDVELARRIDDAVSTTSAGG